MPSPRHWGQVRATVKKPWLKRTWPRPLQAEQVAGTHREQHFPRGVDIAQAQVLIEQQHDRVEGLQDTLFDQHIGIACYRGHGIHTLAFCNIQTSFGPAWCIF